MAKDSELAKLRAEALKRQKAVTRKVSRLKRQFNDAGQEVGPVISGTDLDPRKPNSTIKRYTKTQLRSHIDRLNAFVDRDVQFVGLGDRARTPLPAEEWDRYKALEAQRNAIIRERNRQVENIFVAPQGMTVAQRKRWLERNRNRRGTNPAVNREEVIEREPFSLTKASGLTKLIEAHEKRLVAGYDEEKMAAAHEEFMGMMDRVGDEVMGLMVESLTPGQFDILWNETSFATALGTVYEIMKKQAMGKVTDEERLQQQSQIDGQMEMVADLIEWARKLPR